MISKYALLEIELKTGDRISVVRRFLRLHLYSYCMVLYTQSASLSQLLMPCSCDRHGANADPSSCPMRIHANHARCYWRRLSKRRRLRIYIRYKLMREGGRHRSTHLLLAHRTCAAAETEVAAACVRRGAQGKHLSVSCRGKVVGVHCSATGSTPRVA